jgi:hypothetical protein
MPSFRLRSMSRSECSPRDCPVTLRVSHWRPLTERRQRRPEDHTVRRKLSAFRSDQCGSPGRNSAQNWASLPANCRAGEQQFVITVSLQLAGVSFEDELRAGEDVSIDLNANLGWKGQEMGVGARSRPPFSRWAGQSSSRAR